jgi:hypothetical protein
LRGLDLLQQLAAVLVHLLVLRLPLFKRLQLTLQVKGGYALGRWLWQKVHPAMRSDILREGAGAPGRACRQDDIAVARCSQTTS